MEASNAQVLKNRKKVDKQKKQLVEGGVVPPEKETGKTKEEEKEQEVVQQYFFQDIDEAEEDVKKKESKEKRPEKIITDDKEELEEELEEEIDEVPEVEESEESETIEEEEESIESPEEGETKVTEDKTITLSETAQQALKPYKGKLDEQIDQLVKSYNSALTELKTLQSVKNVLQSFEVPDGTPQEDVINLFKDARTFLSDLEVLPELADVIEGFYSGQIPEDLKPTQKTVKDFMPDDEVYDHQDAVTDNTSASWKARVQWEGWNQEQRQKQAEFLKKISEKRQKSEKTAEMDAKLTEKIKKVKEHKRVLKKFATEEYQVNDDAYEKFVEDFSTFDPELMKVVFAVWARRSNLESKTETKLKSNKTKRSIESEIPSNEREDMVGTVGITKKERDDFESFFGERID